MEVEPRDTVIHQSCCDKFHHEKRKIQQICLEDSCKKDRLLCAFCHAESHLKHNVAFLTDKIDTPMTILKCRYKQENSKQDKIFLQDNLKKINEQATILDRQVTNRLMQALEKIRDEYQCILDTFDQRVFKDAVADLKNQSINKKVVQQYVLRINFLSKVVNIKDSKKLKHQSRQISNSISSAVKNAQTQIFAILDSLKNTISQSSFQFFKEQSEFSFKDSHEDKRQINQVIKKDSLEISQNFFKNVEAQQPSSQRQNMFKRSANGRQYHQQKRKCKLRAAQNNQIYISSSNQQHSSGLCQQIQTSSEGQIQKILHQFKSDPKWQKPKLIIQTKRQCNKFLKVAEHFQKQIGQIKQLSIRNACSLNESQILTIIDNFSLQKISFNNCLNFQFQHARKIYHKFKNLKFLNYSTDWSDDFMYHLESQYFFYPSRQQQFPIQNCQKIAKKLEKLENMWISQCMSTKCIDIIRQMKQLRYLSLEGKSQPRINLIPEEISQNGQLLALAIKNFQNIEQEALNDIFKANNFLQTIVIINCDNFSDDNIRTISINCKNLRQLCLQQLSNIDGKSIWNLLNLQALALSNCHRIDKQSAHNYISTLNKLQFLDLAYSENFADNELMKQINKLTKLKFLGLYRNNKINKQGLKMLTNLHQLQSFICGYTSIICQIVLKHCKQYFPKLKKLNIQYLNTKIGIGIYAYLPALTHLNAKKTQISLENLHKLDVLAIQKDHKYPDSELKILKKMEVDVIKDRIFL